MKPTLFVLLLWAFSPCYAQNSSPVIDSINETVTLSLAKVMPQVNALFDIYVHDTTGVQSIHLKIGTQQGAGDMLDQSFPVAPLPVLHNGTSNALYYHLDGGAYILSPPFIEVWIVFADGSSSAIKDQQLVF